MFLYTVNWFVAHFILGEKMLSFALFLQFDSVAVIYLIFCLFVFFLPTSKSTGGY